MADMQQDVNINAPHPFRRLRRLLANDRKDILYLYSYAILNGLVNLSLPLGIQAIIGLVLAGQVSTSWIILTMIVTVGIAVAGLLQIVQLSITEILQQRIFAKSAFEFAYRIPRFNTEALGAQYPPELINRFFDTLNIQKGLPKILMEFSASSLQIIFGLILLSFYHPVFIIFGIVLITVLVLIFYITGPRGLESSLQESNFKYKVAHWLKELARSLNTFKLAGQTDLPLGRTDDLVQNYLKHRKKHFRVLILQYANIVGFKSLITLGLLVIGGILVINNEINVGQFVASEIIIILIMNSAEKLILTMEPIYDVLTAVEKISNVTDMPLESENGSLKFNEIDTDKGLALSLRNVNYLSKTDDKHILKDISLKIDPNERVCVTGPNGSGKTTLINVITGLYDKYQGSIIINDYPIGNLNEPELRRYTGVAYMQDDVFAGTLQDNISLGRKGITRENIKWAVDNLYLTDFVQSLPEGFETRLESTGGRLASSIVKKIILARAIVGDPKLIVMDDMWQAFSDSERKKIVDFMTDPQNNWTLIGISTDPYYMSNCDRVIHMQDGNIIKDSIQNSHA
jgi:ABC-type bacteriocin/lantibiotic exporter with double-glycine peptidase domain